MDFRAKRNHMPVRDDLHASPWVPSERDFIQPGPLRSASGTTGALAGRHVSQRKPSQPKQDHAEKTGCFTHGDSFHMALHGPDESEPRKGGGPP